MDVKFKGAKATAHKDLYQAALNTGNVGWVMSAGSQKFQILRCEN